MNNSKIRLLSDEVINKIAAGEVIERPASVVKELIENSLDAQSSFIKVQIEEGGKSKITITDDGEGMSLEDLNLCYIRHSTSKLRVADDLFALRTNGFRGEAVASIAAISKLTIISKTKDMSAGNKITLLAGEVQNQTATSAPIGTTFIIEDLFYNTPVRKQFLSSNNAEATRILDVITRLAIAHPKVRFEYKNAAKDMFIGNKTDLKNRLAEAISSNIAKKLIPLTYADARISVTGFISPAESSTRKRGRFYLYIKNRPFSNSLIVKAIQKAYEAYAKSIAPVAVLFLDMPDEYFDVNVHPAKKEVRFSNPSEIYTAVYRAVKNTLYQETFGDSATINLKGYSDSQAIRDAGHSWSHFDEKPPVPNSKNSSLLELEESISQDLFSSPEFGTVITLSNQSFQRQEDTLQFTPPSFLQLADTYILSQDKEGILIIDQHAAHSRVLFEEALATFNENKKIVAQELLFAELMEFTTVEKSILKEILTQLNSLGFDIEDFGGNHCRVRAIPGTLSISKAEQSIRDIIEQVQEENYSESIPFDSLIKIWASTTAFRANEKLSHDTIVALVNQLLKTEEPLESPFGKPTMIRIPIEDIHKKFKR